MPSYRRLPLLVLAALTPAAAMASDGPLQVAAKVLVESRTNAADGSVQTRYTPVRTAVPGDRVVFVLAYRNTGAQPIDQLVLDNPLPAAIAYRAPAQGSAAPEVSVDGKIYGALDTLRVRLADGGTRAARGEDVTHVRWRMAGPVPARSQGQFAFQAVLK